MSTFKGTPGPWRAAEWECHARTTVLADSNVVVAECSGHGRHSDESLADAAAIAQVPAMVQIVTALLDADAPHHARVDLAMILAREVHAALREGGAL